MVPIVKAIADVVLGMNVNDSYAQGQSINIPAEDGGLSVVYPPAFMDKGEARATDQVLVMEDDGE